MQDFIKMAAGQLGVSEETSSSATKGVLGMLQSNMDGGDFSALAGALPGNVGALLGGGDAAGEPAPAGGGLGGALGGMLGGGGGAPAGGGLGGALGGMLGGGGAAAGGLGGALGGALGGGGAMAAAMQLASSGLGKEQAGQFVTLFLNFVKSEAGGDMLSKVLAAVPQLKALAGMVG